MIGIFQEFVGMVVSFFPLFFLFSIFLIGYYLAWNDFTPKSVNEEEENSLLTQFNAEPVRKSRELMNKELGIEDIDNIGALSDTDQRRLKMHEVIKEYSTNKPEDAASVIKGWLSE